MVLESKSVLGLEAIMPVLDEYVVWYGKLVKSYFEGRAVADPAPAVFSEWLTKAIVEKSVNGSLADKIQGVHAEMVNSAKAFALKAAIKSTGPAPLKEYDELSRHYEEFIQFMRRLEKDRATENSGFDDLTGLRSVRLMNADLMRELERRSRQGNPFSLALLKINNFKDEWRQDKEICRPMVRHLSQEINECLRSFDDAYYIGEEYFLLSLKHADIHGSQAAMTRLNMDILAADIQDPNGEPVTVSSVLSEPTPGDSPDTLLANMKKDLEGIETKGTIVQYHEMSPIQRYIHSMTKGK